ncbi:hypothetical protein DTO013E5_5167 [Penicillium roqueforti]|nr:uncharacterized protein LCP9604111_5584 [Penicillium roqueforti]KAF9248329.1 hypothetical protein LCP9604111_5584 [Penicillium roqueforti]KAI2680020.1 hypothetical protein LCP963914a_7110 [Penicillium roqueforti]KAI2683210.1 hypothetical protein CBS147355_2350 [Penicillium roqueforti]KAI2701778.1 hypothetical protein CBS147372_4831 [Penicillium roqueforti]KAI2722209.1 hypothetical protein CBS147318_2824 [Penicillium roqueforti]
MPSDSELSSLSSAPPTDDEATMAIDHPTGIAKYFKKESETPPPKREPSPPHEYVVADNPDIAFIVAFRARFHEVFPKGVPHYGPQDIEKGIEESPPGEYIERLLCALLGLVLNRKKEVERNHFTRPLEEAIHTHQAQWPKEWEGKNPLHGGGSFATMSPVERLRLLRTLILWSLSSSEAVQAKIKESYKQARHDDDLNQPLSVQPWGRDSLKRRYWLIEGHDDTNFRLYRESNPALKNNTWWSIAGSIPELEAVVEKLEGEKGTNSKKLSERIRASIPRFEASEEKRRRREYRLARKAAFVRPDPGFSMYEGRTRGKKLKYTYSDDDDIFSDDDEPSARRSTRNAAPTEASTESRRPRFTASGRQIRSRAGGLYGEALLIGQRNGADDDEFDEDDEEEVIRPQRARTSTHPNGYSGYDADDLEDASEVPSSANESGNEWQGVEDDLEHDVEGDNEEDEASADESSGNEEPESLVVQLRYGKGDAPSNLEVQIKKSPPAKEVEIAEETAAASSAQAPPKTLHQSNSDAQQAPTMIATSHPFASIPQVPTHSAAAVAAPSVSSNGVDQI